MQHGMFTLCMAYTSWVQRQRPVQRGLLTTRLHLKIHRIRIRGPTLQAQCGHGT